MTALSEVNRKLTLYLQLIRWQQPIGTWLLCWPCWWSITLASDGLPSAKLLALFLLGSFIMRSAGCIMNDLWDRDIDAQVERTKNRPLASGALSPLNALTFLLLLLLCALLIVIQLPIIVFLLAVAALPMVALYPAMKRITWWPQAFLGLTFNFGALMGWAAVTETVQLPAILLYIGGIFWTLGYDTIYAHQDIADDSRIGVKSTARLFGNRTKSLTILFYSITSVCLAAALYATQAPSLSYLFLGFPLIHFLHQIRTLDINNPALCGDIFRSNHIAGLLIFLAFMANSLAF